MSQDQTTAEALTYKGKPRALPGKPSAAQHAATARRWIAKVLRGDLPDCDDRTSLNKAIATLEKIERRAARA